MNLFPKDPPLQSEGYSLDILPSLGSSDIETFLKYDNSEDNCLPSSLSDAFPPNFNLSPEEINSTVKSPDSTMHNIVPCPTSRFPATDDFKGLYNFDIVLDKSVGEKFKWEFSKQLNKIFAMMGYKVPIKFKWDPKVCGLFVRALPIFLAPDSFEEPVRRCACHSSHMEKSNEGFHHVDHIIRCDHSHTSYEMNQESQRFSVVVPLDPPQPGSDGTTVVYSFMCKNSCPVGMNRRSTAIIFTLESANGEVLGRKLLKMRICSCPHRDMTKEEKAEKNDVEESPCIRPVKKELKRLSKESGMINFNIRIPEASAKSVATIIKEVFSHRSQFDKKEMTAEELIVVQDCNKYI